MGLDADTFGNHNFDHGLDYMRHLIERADYPFTSADLSNLGVNSPASNPRMSSSRSARRRSRSSVSPIRTQPP